MGSPKGKGSGYKAVQAIEKRLKELDEFDFEYLFLKDANLGLCKGCYICMRLGEDKCPLKDDRAAIEKKITEADGLILSSPVHVANVSWLLKNFMDRFAYANHRPRFHGKKALLVSNSAGSSQKAALAAMSNIHYSGMKIVGRLALTTPPWPETEKAVAKKERAIDSVAVKLYRACLNEGRTSPGIEDLTVFLIMKKYSAVTKDIFPADYQFYSGKEYYYNTKVGPLKKLIAECIKSMGFFLMRDRLPGNVKWPRNEKKDQMET